MPVIYSSLVNELAGGSAADATAPAGGPLGGARLNALGPGEPLRDARAALATLDYDALCAPHRLADAAAARACIAGLWLRNDFLAESHSLSQTLDNDDGNLWHAIMHRREPDANNAAYWFRRVGPHAIFAPLCRAAADLSQSQPCDDRAQFLARQSTWNALAFIDLCDIYRGTGSSTELLCQRIQLREWELLFAHCWRRAVGQSD